MKKPLKKVDLHPATIKHLSLGHFWVTEDSFTKKFPQNELFLIGIDSKTKKEIGLFLNDPEHKNVKARLFSTEVGINFDDVLKLRINQALKKRFDLNLWPERENILLINGENDGLPGLLVLQLKNHLIVQYYAFYWKHFEENLLTFLTESLQTIFPHNQILNTWIQERNFNQKKSIRSLAPTSDMPEFSLQEFGLNYLIRINAYYDYGIYTDMSAIRKLMKPIMHNKKNGLNLFCYTGAYSLFALKEGIEKMTSVDLSEKYLQWLDDNLKLNTDQIQSNRHRSINLSVEKAIDQLIHEKDKFDFILSDPPSASSDGEKQTNALTSYEKLLPKLLDILTPNGALIVFLNTHQISWNKFEEKLKTIIINSKYKDQVIIGKRFKLSEDCLPVKGFHEGDYLKGLLIEFKKGHA